jgi:uncharacterized membrane protein
MLVGPAGQFTASAALVFLIAWILFTLRKFPAGTEEFTASFTLVLLLQLVVLPLTAGFNHVMTFPAALLLIRRLLSSRRQTGIRRSPA